MEWPAWPFTMKDTLDVIAGALGGASRWGYLNLIAKDPLLKITAGNGVAGIFMGLLCAHFFAGAGDYVSGLILSPFIEPGGSTTAAHLGSFLLGMSGVYIIGLVMDTVRLKFTPKLKDEPK